jgi:hypothetical protein
MKRRLKFIEILLMVCFIETGILYFSSAWAQEDSEPLVDIKADDSDGPITVPEDTWVTLTWDSTNASATETTGGLSGPASYTYTLTCTGLEEVEVCTRAYLPTCRQICADQGYAGCHGTRNYGSGPDCWRDDCCDYGCDKRFGSAYLLGCWCYTEETSDSVIVNVGEESTLSVNLEAIPGSGTAPLNDVDLKATVSGTAQGTINYKFDCEDDGAWDYVFNNVWDNPKTVFDACNYASVETYIAKVYVERGTAVPAEDTVTITVSSALPRGDYDVWGWAWSENIGWVSFSSDNTGASVEYGVFIDGTNGKLSGYAWSEHIGWVSFNQSDLSGCPVAPCKAEVDLNTGHVSGWARALVDGGGWEGWLRLRDASHGVYGVWIDPEPDPAEFVNWAWSDLNIGWLSFNCRNQNHCSTSDYKVMTSLDFEPEIPVPRVFNPGFSFDNPCAQSRIPTLTWETDAQIPYDYEIEIDDKPGFNSPEVKDQAYGTSNTFWAPGAGDIQPSCSYCCDISPYNNIAWVARTYYWRIRARNSGGSWSEWARGVFATKLHCYPYPDFVCNGGSCATLRIDEEEPIILTDNSTYYNGRHHCNWSLPGGAVVVSGNPWWDCQIEVQFAQGDNQSVTLTAFDSAGYSCPETKILDVSEILIPPEWKEIKP